MGCYDNHEAPMSLFPAPPSRPTPAPARHGTCPVCGGWFRVTVADEMRAHGKPANRCPGSGADPLPSILIRTEIGGPADG